MSPAKKLSQLVPCETGRIARIGFSDSVRGRFAALGISPGAEITAMYDNPRKDSCVYLVRSCLLAIRKADAEKISLN